MSEIRCRGQMDGGAWVYGYYLQSANRKVKLIVNYPDTESALPCFNIIKAETLGLSSRLYDELGEEIFEHDLLKIGGVIFEVVFEKGAFITRRTDDGGLYDGVLLNSWSEHVIRKIGNAFDGVTEE